MSQLISRLFSLRNGSSLVFGVCGAALCCLSPVSALADSVTIANPVAITSTINLSAPGNDWAHYATANPPTDGQVSLTFDHPASTGFSGLSGINGGIAGWDYTTSSAPLMTWSGGTPDSTGSSHSQAFNSNNYSESGLSLTYNLAPGPKLINLYVHAFNGVSSNPLPVELEASLSSGPSATNTTALPAFWVANTYEDGDYMIQAVNSSASVETLTLSYLQTVSQNGAADVGSNVGIFGVTAGAVPEPGSVSVLAVASLALLRRKRDKRTPLRKSTIISKISVQPDQA